MSTAAASTYTTPCKTISSIKTTKLPPVTTSTTKTSTRTTTKFTKTTTISTIIKSTAICTAPVYKRAGDHVFTGTAPTPSSKATRDRVPEFGWLQGRGTRGLVKGVADNAFDKRALFIYRRAPGKCVMMSHVTRLTRSLR